MPNAAAFYFRAPPLCQRECGARQSGTTGQVITIETSAVAQPQPWNDGPSREVKLGAGTVRRPFLIVCSCWFMALA